MDTSFLCQLGFSENQANAYRALVLKKCLRPNQLAKLIGESRANCYAILNKLVEQGLARKVDENNKLTYYPESPSMIEAIIAKNVATEQSRLSALQQRLPQMLSAYSADDGRPRVETYEGKDQLTLMYESQASPNGGHMQFIHSRKDIPFFGVEKMKKIRHLAVKNKVYRQAISPFVKAFYNPVKDKKFRLRRTWIDTLDYSSPVEWSVRDDTINIMCFHDKGYGVSIKHKEIANSFKQIFLLLDKNIRENPVYKDTYPTSMTQMAPDKKELFAERAAKEEATYSSEDSST